MSKKKDLEAFQLLNSISGIVCRNILIDKGFCTAKEFDDKLNELAKDLQRAGPKGVLRKCSA